MLRKKQKNHQSSTNQIKIPQYICEPVQTVHGEIVMKKYIKLKSIGHGSYSKVFLVQNTSSESTYAVKVIPKNKLEILMREKLFYEIKIHQSLIHENIVYFDHWFEDEDYQYIFMEYCANGNLDAYVKNLSTTVPEKQIKIFGYQIVNAIKYIHEQNILHRDLKLCNFYLTENNQVKLGDFGFACQLANAYDKKRQSCGTPNYIAPEAISGFGYSYSSDVWSIGVILFRMKFGYCPFEGMNVRETLQKVKLCQYRFPKNVKVSPQLKDLISQIFNINYDERITTTEILNHKFFSDFNIESYIKSPIEISQNEKKSSSLFARIFNKSTEKKQNSAIDKLKKIVKTQIEQKKQQSSEFGPQSELEANITSPQMQNHGLQKKSNSCETLKQIKQIFKSKSKQKSNLNHNATLQTLPSMMTMLSSRTSSDKEQLSSILYSRNSVRRNEDLKTSFYDIDQRKEETTNRVSRLNQFIKNRAETLSINEDSSKINTGQKYKTNSTQNRHKTHILQKITNQYSLPTSIQYEKDIIIIHYEGNIKQIITQAELPKNKVQKADFTIKSFSDTTIDTNNSALTNKMMSIISNQGSLAKQICYLLFLEDSFSEEDERGSVKIYKSDMLEKQMNPSELPKLITYIIENKIKWERPSRNEENTEIFADNMLCGDSLQMMQDKIAHNWIICKDGVILQYQKRKCLKEKILQSENIINSFIVSKMVSQKYFYVSETDRKLQSQKLTNKSLQMIYEYTPQTGKYQIIEEVGILRMYMGWSRINFKQ